MKAITLTLLLILLFSTLYADVNEDLFVAIKKGEMAAIQAALAAGANVNVRNSSGDTPLMWLAAKGNTVAMNLLITQGADVNAANKNGRTALMYATLTKHLNAVNVLLRAGANVNAKDKQGMTAYAEASKRGYTAMLDILKPSEDVKISEIPTEKPKEEKIQKTNKKLQDMYEKNKSLRQLAEKHDPKITIGYNYCGEGKKNNKDAMGNYEWFNKQIDNTQKAIKFWKDIKKISPEIIRLEKKYNVEKAPDVMTVEEINQKMEDLKNVEDFLHKEQRRCQNVNQQTKGKK